MVVGPDSEKEHRRPASLSASASNPGPASVPGSVSAISSTSFFDSPHFSRRQPYKSMPVPVSSEQPSEHGEGNPRGYRPPPPGYGSHYPYGYPPGGHHYGPPTPGYSHHHGGPPPGYPHHHHSHPSAYSPPPGYHGRSMYGYGGGYDGSGSPPPGYPMQQSRDGVPSKSPPFRRPGGGASSGDSVTGIRSTASGSQRASPVGGARRDTPAKASPEQTAAAPPQDPSPPQQGRDSSPALSNNPPRSSPTKIADEIETERLRQAALEEISASQVEPIKTAFHFFVMDMRERLRPLAEAEVRKSISAGEGEPLDPYLVNSNMNCRLMKAWEDLNEDSRQACMRKEEDDRRRFMEEEEIASRHCATLTARSKSPKTPERRSSNQTVSSLDPNYRGTPSASPTSMVSAAHPGPSPSPISRMAMEKSASMDNDEKKMDDSAPTASHSKATPSPIKSGVLKGGLGEGRLLSPNPRDSEEEAGTKRPSPSKPDETGKTPPKRNRLEEEAAKEKAAEEKSA